MTGITDFAIDQGEKSLPHFPLTQTKPSCHYFSQWKLNPIRFLGSAVNVWVFPVSENILVTKKIH